MNKFLGVCLLGLSLVPFLPVYGALYYDGVGDILDWPWIFYAFLAIGVTLAFFGFRLLFTSQRVGAEASFDQDGFTVAVRRFLQRDINKHLLWSEIEEMKLVKAPRGGDYLSFRLSHDAAVHHGLIEPTTRQTASKKLVKREVPFPPKLSGVSAEEAVARFQASAKVAGMKLTEVASLNLVIFERKVWKVSQITAG